MSSKFFLLAGDSNSFKSHLKPDCVSGWSWVTKCLTDSPHGKTSVVSCCFSYCQTLIKNIPSIYSGYTVLAGKETKPKCLSVTRHKIMRYFSFILLQTINFKHKRALCLCGSVSQMVETAAWQERLVCRLQVSRLPVWLFPKVAVNFFSPFSFHWFRRMMSFTSEQSVFTSKCDHG